MLFILLLNFEDFLINLKLRFHLDLRLVDFLLLLGQEVPMIRLVIVVQANVLLIIFILILRKLLIKILEFFGLLNQTCYQLLVKVFIVIKILIILCEFFIHQNTWPRFMWHLFQNHLSPIFENFYISVVIELFPDWLFLKDLLNKTEIVCTNKTYDSFEYVCARLATVLIIIKVTNRISVRNRNPDLENLFV